MLRTILKPLSFVPALIMMYIIFSFSAQDGDMSGQLSYQASVKIIETADYVFNANLSYDQIDEWANKIDFITRKLAHMTEYFALAIAVSFPLYVYGLHGILLMFLAGLICVGFACGDEFHQSFIAGRSPSSRDVCIDSVGVFFGIIVVRIIGWTGRKTVFKEKVKVKQKKPKKKLFGGKSKTTYYDKYGNYQPPQPDDRYYQNPGSGYGYDNRGQDYGYDSRYDSRSGRNYYEQPGGNPNYGYDNRGGRDYYGQPEGNPNYGYDNRGGNRIMVMTVAAAIRIMAMITAASIRIMVMITAAAIRIMVMIIMDIVIIMNRAAKIRKPVTDTTTASRITANHRLLTAVTAITMSSPSGSRSHSRVPEPGQGKK